MLKTGGKGSAAGDTDARTYSVLFVLRFLTVTSISGSKRPLQRSCARQSSDAAMDLVPA